MHAMYDGRTERCPPRRHRVDMQGVGISEQLRERALVLRGGVAVTRFLPVAR